MKLLSGGTAIAILLERHVPYYIFNVQCMCCKTNTKIFEPDVYLQYFSNFFFCFFLVESVIRLHFKFLSQNANKHVIRVAESFVFLTFISLRAGIFVVPFTTNARINLCKIFTLFPSKYHISLTKNLFD